MRTPAVSSYSGMSPLELVIFLQKHHHSDTRQKVGQLNHRLQLLLRANWEPKIDLLQVYQNFLNFKELFEQHLNKEEHILFPFIKETWRVAQSGKADALPQDTLFLNPLRVFRAEHVSLVVQMKRIREAFAILSADKTLPFALKGLIRSVGALERNLEEHIHLENNLLYPSLLRLGREIKERADRAKQAKSEV